MCAGAIHTPALLQRSGFRGLVGKALAVHPTVKLAARFDEAINVTNDVPVHQVKEFAPELSFGGSASHPGLVALALTDNWTENNVTWSNTAADFDPMVSGSIHATSQETGVVANLPGLVQGWLGGVWPNHGVMLQSTSTGNMSLFSSRERQPRPPRRRQTPR